MPHPSLGHPPPDVHAGLPEAAAKLRAKDFKIDSEGSAGTPTCEDGNHLAFISLVASYMARSVHVFLEADKMVGFSISPMGAVVV